MSYTRPMGPILITSFEPFGLTGRFLRRANASHDIADMLKPQLPGQGYDFLRLPVSRDAIRILRDHLTQTRPSGILCMGEDLGLRPGTINLEPYAYDTDVHLNPLKSRDVIDRIHSDFVRTAMPAQERSTIGLFHCNAVYREALTWGRDHGNAPAAFIHVSVLGDREAQARNVMDILPLLARMAKPAPAPAPAA